MSFDISGFGIQVRIIALPTFPTGFTVTQFADDADPFDIASQVIAETAMTLNGDLVTWSSATPIPVTLNVIAGSDDDRNLSILYSANRVGIGKIVSRDIITMIGTYPDGRSITLTNGKLVEGMAGNSIASAGRFKSKPYIFQFENKVEV